MYIIFDARHIKNKFSGLGRFTFSILLELIIENRYKKIDILLDKNVDYMQNEVIKHIETYLNDLVSIVLLDAPLFNLRKSFNITKYVNSTNANLYFHPHFDLPFGIKTSCKFVVHDVFSKKNFCHEDENNRYKDFLYAIKKKRFIKNLVFNNMIKYNLYKDNINCIAVSHSTKKDMLEFIPERYESKIKVVHEASFERNILSETNSETKINKNYLLYVGDRRPHKNLKKMIDIFDKISQELDDNLYFYIVGSQEKIYFDYTEYIKKIDNKKIVEISNVSDDVLNGLYKNALAFFFLSKHEGFGLPLLEAAKYNIKIITSNQSSLIEVAPAGSLLMDPYIDIDVGASLVNIYLNEKSNLNYLQYLKTFNWKKSMREIFYEK